jgi:hypothetical protein
MVRNRISRLLMAIRYALILVAVMAFIAEAQTNRTIRFSESEVDGGTKVIEWEFTLDSLAGLVSPTFTMADYDGVDFNTYPITFKRKTVSTYGTPKLDIFLQGLYQSNSDSTSLDTIAFQQTGETDSTGNLKLHGSNGITPTRAVSYRFYARCLNADINSGKITAVIPRKERE